MSVSAVLRPRTSRLASPAGPRNSSESPASDKATVTAVNGGYEVAGAKVQARHVKVKGVFGFRAGMILAGAIPATLLNVFVPIIALSRGDVTLPNVMLSDVMASHRLYEAFYTWGFSISMVSVCFVLRESSFYWRREMPSLAPDVDRFIFILYCVVAPCLFGLVSFQYNNDMSFEVLSSGTFIDVVNNFDFVLWFMHVFYTSVFFLGCCAMACIYIWHLNPKLGANGLVHPVDRFWRDATARCIALLTPVGVVVRLLHLFIGSSLWGILLVIVEVALIQLFVAGGFIGVMRLMMELDAQEPMVDVAHIKFF